MPVAAVEEQRAQTKLGLSSEWLAKVGQDTYLWILEMLLAVYQKGRHCRTASTIVVEDCSTNSNCHRAAVSPLAVSSPTTPAMAP